MIPKKFYQKHDKKVVEQMAEQAGTTFANFQQIALYGGSCSKAMAKRLEQASGGEMTRNEILFPEEHEPQVVEGQV